jgi:hypothetical protein
MNSTKCLFVPSSAKLFRDGGVLLNCGLWDSSVSPSARVSEIDGEACLIATGLCRDRATVRLLF